VTADHDAGASMARDPLADRVDDLAAFARRSGGRVTLEHVPFLAQVSLRLDPAWVGRAPYPLPLEPNTAWEDGPRAALWLGPDEWLVLGPPHAAPEIVSELESSLEGVHRSVVDVSANRVAIELGGSGRYELLSSGCSLDLHPRAWRTGMCAQTLFAKAQVILHERADTTGMLVRPSFADYLIDRLLTAISSS
jgi:sarcosine oxidase, subunit gamma